MGEAKTIAIIGGGASGLAAAVAAGEALRDSEGDAGAARVVVYEASDRVGRSILATGNGHCNFSNARPDEGDYRNAAFVRRALFEFDRRASRYVPSQAKTSTAYPNGVLGFFSDHGLMWREEGEGRLYPLANKAASVLDCLRAACAAAGVEERVECEVAAVEPPRAEGAPFTLRLADGRFERAGVVIVAVGGTVARELLPKGLSFREPEPTLGPLATDPRWPRRLDNIRVRGALELWRPGEKMTPQELNRHGFPMGTHEGERLVSREVGEAMFRKYGVSGIAAFNLSRLAEPDDVLAVDFVPWVRLCDMEAFLNRRRKLLRASLGRDVTWSDMLRGMVLSPVADVLLEAAALDGAHPVAKGETVRMATFLKGLRLPVTGLGDVRQCQVHRGGVSVRAVDDRTCEVRRVPGLYVVGEALDVDAACGGFNLHWAWASGLLAGWSAAERIADLASLADASGSSGSERREGAPCSNSIEVQGSSRVAGGNLCTSMNCARTPSPLRRPYSSIVEEGVALQVEVPLTVREGRAWLTREVAVHPPRRWALPAGEACNSASARVAVELRDVWFRYERDGADVLRGTTLTVPGGSLFAVVGGNGTGKSTMLRAICGVARPYRGKITVLGRRLKEWKKAELFRGGVALLPQDPLNLMVKKTVRGDLEEMLDGRGLTAEQRVAAVREVATLTDIAPLLDAHPFDLSGGEVQRAALAKVLLSEPRLLLLDEPTKGLDAFFKDKLAALLRSLTARGTTVLMVSHDIEFCASYADRCALFFDGDVVTTNPPRQFFASNSFYTTAANRISRGFFENVVTVEEVVELCRS